MSNIVILEGHIGHDLELKTTTTNGKSVLNFRMATNRKFNNAMNQLVEDTQWHNIVCWDKTAINVAGMQHKGSHVLVEGRLQTREFLGQVKYDNGQIVGDAAGNPIMVKRYTTEVVARRVVFLDKKPGTAVYPAAPGVAVQPIGAVPATPATVAATFVGAAPAVPAVEIPAAEAAAIAAAAAAIAANTVAPVHIPGV